LPAPSLGLGAGRTVSAPAVAARPPRLQHKDIATTGRVRDGETLLTDGPFIETKEFIGGITAIYCDERQQAIDIAAALPLAGHHRIEVRPFYRE
jgi:hypothetical protein